MDCVLRAWCDSDVTHVIVVLRRTDRSLARVCQKCPAEIVRPPRDPRDMKESIQFGLSHVTDVHSPTAEDRWMFAPADLPRLNVELINQLVHRAGSRDCVVAPRFGRRQGHPVSLPWPMSAHVRSLSQQQGLKAVLDGEEIDFLDLPAEERVGDVDTPEQYRRLKNT